MATCTLLKWEPRLQAQLATGRPGVSSAGTGRPHQIWSFSHGPGGWACCLDTRPMGGWASIPFFCSGRAGGRRDFAVENRVGVGGRPGTPGPVGGPDFCLFFANRLRLWIFFVNTSPEPAALISFNWAPCCVRYTIARYLVASSSESSPLPSPHASPPPPSTSISNFSILYF